MSTMSSPKRCTSRRTSVTDSDERGRRGLTRPARPALPAEEGRGRPRTRAHAHVVGGLVDPGGRRSIGTVAAAGLIAVAGKAAGLFDAAREFDTRQFTVRIAKVLAILSAVAAIIPAVLRLFGVD